MQDRVIALGFFDGVHLGHAALLREAVHVAQQTNAIAAALTFETHPEMLTVGKMPPLINTETQREQLMTTLYGIQEVIKLPFDDEMRQVPWDIFIEAYLLKRYCASHIVVGHDFHFGYQGKGTPDKLAAACVHHGVGCTIIPKVSIGDVQVSATHIRRLLAAGDVASARQFLGYAYTVCGAVVTGQRIGTTIGTPTVNVTLPPYMQELAHGVYVTQTLTNGVSWPSVTNVGVRPTVEAHGRVVIETTLLGFTGDLYGNNIEVSFYEFLRPEKRFPDLDALKTQIALDIAQAIEYNKSNVQ